MEFSFKVRFRLFLILLNLNISNVSAFAFAHCQLLTSASRRILKQTHYKATSSLDDVQRIFAISDLHTDNLDNLKWLKENCASGSPLAPTSNDALIIAGDISHEISKLVEAFSIIRMACNCHIFFVFGNHEAWIGGREMDSLGITTSLQKIQMVKDVCEKEGIHTDTHLVGSNYENPVFIVPIESWYDGSLSLPGCEDLSESFDKWPWMDFKRCVWPKEEELVRLAREQNLKTNPAVMPKNINIGKIPIGLTEFFSGVNQNQISKVKDYYQNSKSLKNRSPGLITYSHFLPSLKTLPDWKDPLSDSFDRGEWLDHPVPKVSANFAKVSGSSLIDETIRSLLKDVNQMSCTKIHHLHIFGHSHRPKDFVIEGIRYIHNPLGKPKERDMKMVSSELTFQLIWDCSKSLPSDVPDDDDISYSGGVGEIPGVRVIRFWEERGGGKNALSRRMKVNSRVKKVLLNVKNDGLEK